MTAQEGGTETTRFVLRRGVERRRLIGLDHFGGLLALIVASVVLSPLLNKSEVGGAIAGTLAGLVLVGSYVAAGVRPRVTAVVTVVAVLAVSASVAGTLAVAGTDTPDWVFALTTVMLAASPFVVLRRILQHAEVTLATVGGALCAYLLVGVAFSAVYLTIDAFYPGSFSTDIEGAATYFSFVTLTTLGYGDITAVSELARSLAILEAVMGQVLLVTLVARFVSTLGQKKSVPGEARRSPESLEPPAAGPEVEAAVTRPDAPPTG